MEYLTKSHVKGNWSALFSLRNKKHLLWSRTLWYSRALNAAWQPHISTWPIPAAAHWAMSTQVLKDGTSQGLRLADTVFTCPLMTEKHLLSIRVYRIMGNEVWTKPPGCQDSCALVSVRVFSPWILVVKDLCAALGPCPQPPQEVTEDKGNSSSP